MDKYSEKFKTETVYLFIYEEDAYAKHVPGKGWFVKFPGEKEYPIKHTSRMVMLAYDGKREVTRSEYENA